MRKVFFTSSIALLLFTFLGCSEPERRPPPPRPEAAPPRVAPAEHIANRIRELQQRIDDGVRSGDLLSTEAKNLQQRLDGIKADFDRVRERGLDPFSVDALNRRLDSLDRDIFGQRRDYQRRW
ncbi:MAG: hypothetical protein HY754_14385 [Nitrospirae bacterium]|nr:hypothetical protein [Nitrospirota bacterium]